MTWCAKTDASGEFALRGLSTAEYRFEFNTAGDVNYVEALTSPHLVQAGTEAILEAHLVPGVKVEGTLTEAGTGLPVEGLTVPYSVPTICALDSATEKRIKCTAVGIGGHYKLPGLPPGRTFGVAFAVDGVEEGLDLRPDGYVRQYWDHVPTWQEAAFIFGSGGSTFAGIDAVLGRGAEVFPHCEVATACPPPESGGGVVIPSLPTQSIPATPPLLPWPEIHCKSGYRKMGQGAHARCVKIHKKKPKRHKHPRHHLTSDRNR